MIKKRWKKILAASLVVGNLFFLPIVNAEIKTYSAMGVDYGNELESQDIVKLRARDKAIKNAVKQAGVYLKSYSRSINSELTDDEITAITSNTYEIVGEVKYNQVAKQVTDQVILVMWEATVDVKVDDSEIKNWYKRDSDERSKLITQTRETNEAAAENERKVEDLRKRANTVTDDAGRAQLKKDFEQVDNEFLSNQKVEEGTRLAYQGQYDEAIKLYTEAIELNPNNIAAYYARAGTYHALSIRNENDAKKFRTLAINDLNKAIEIKPDYSDAYGYRGMIYYFAKDYTKAINDFNRAIEIDPTNAQNYIYRSLYYTQVLKDNNRALADLNKAIELEPNNAHCYINRATFYELDLKNYGRAIDDFNKAIELEPNNPYAYAARARFYSSPLIDSALRDYSRAAEDYSRAIELQEQPAMVAMNYYNRGECYRALKIYDKAIDDYTQAIELGTDNAVVQTLLKYIYHNRGKCYEKLGDTAKAKADFDKAKALGYNL